MLTFALNIFLYELNYRNLQKEIFDEGICFMLMS